MTTSEEIFSLFREGGADAYFGERVTQEEHALQSAALARNSGAPDSLVVAALLHDVGHLLHGLGEGVAEQGIDAAHETVGEAWLASRFGPAVSEPARLHVAAKRYLCGSQPDYLSRLSEASVQSLELQGGPMSPGEIAEFERSPYWRDTLRLRAWDDAAKIPGLEVPSIGAYAKIIERVRVDRA